MTRSKADTAAAKPAASSSRRKVRGGGRRQEAATTEAAAPEEWSKDLLESMTPLETHAYAAGTESSRKGWGELPAAERASRSKQLEEMGFTASAAHRALVACDWDVNKALDLLFTTGGVPPSATDAKAQEASVGNTSTVKKTVTTLTGTPVKCKDSTTCDSTSASGGEHEPGSPDSDDADPLLPPGLESLPPKLGISTLPPGLELMPQAATQPAGSMGRVVGAPEITAATTAVAAAALATVPAGLSARSPEIWPSSGVVPLVPPARAGTVVPKRELAKVKYTWECEESCSDTQLSVEDNEFIRVWAGSKTETGWIYAESLICSSRAGWLPESMLHKLPSNKQWMRISSPCSAAYPTQLSVESGSMVVVDKSHTPVNGWIYAEDLSSATGRHVPGVHGSAGWVPIQCVEWAEF